MTIDVNLCGADEDFFDNLDDIMEDSMVQMFFIHPTTLREITEAKKIAGDYGSIFYSLPLHLSDQADENCIAYSVVDEQDRALLSTANKPLVIDESYLNESLRSLLADCRGVILNATHENSELPNFLLALGAGTIGAFDTESLNKMSMDRLVLQSTYPSHGFEEIAGAVKVISDAMLRPEQSIIARATKSSLELFGFRKS